MEGKSLLDVSDDGLVCPEVGGWAETKHRLVELYASLFSTGMKAKWDKRVYVELYAGAGYSKVQDTSRVILGSPLHALGVKHPFDKYVFCEEITDNLEALKVRVRRHAPAASVAYIQGDCNQRTADIIAEIPAGSKGNTVLSLCFVDPYDIGIKFDTLRNLSQHRPPMDFVVLLAVYMDAVRNYDRYVSEDSVKVDEFLGSNTWRERWSTAQQTPQRFPQFLATEFARSMESLGYRPTPLHTMKRVKSSRPSLYYLALFSRSPRAYKFWDEVLKYSTKQRTLF